MRTNISFQHILRKKKQGLSGMVINDRRNILQSRRKIAVDYFLTHGKNITRTIRGIQCVCLILYIMNTIF